MFLIHHRAEFCFLNQCALLCHREEKGPGSQEDLTVPPCPHSLSTRLIRNALSRSLSLFSVFCFFDIPLSLHLFFLFSFSFCTFPEVLAPSPPPAHAQVWMSSSTAQRPPQTHRDRPTGGGEAEHPVPLGQPQTGLWAPLGTENKGHGRPSAPPPQRQELKRLCGSQSCCGYWLRSDFTASLTDAPPPRQVAHPDTQGL